ncbi:MAG: DUF3592 domain-containing protein [Flavobacteriales bacterium]|nr:DUF3592 domain-containing protein [Flavobacteriales bacterium]
MKKTKLVSIGLIVFGIALVFWAVMQFNNTNDFIENGNKTTATVIELIEEYDEGSATYTPVFKYINELDETITFESSVSSNPPSYRIGDVENIIYMPNTDDARIDSTWGLYLFTIALSIIATLSIIFGFIFFVAPKNISSLE